MTPGICRSYDLWANAEYSPVFVGPLYISMLDVDVSQSVGVSLSGLRNNRLTPENASVATDVLIEFFEPACATVDRNASDLGAGTDTDTDEPTPAPDPTATAVPEPTAAPAPAPEATVTPEPTATPQPEPTATPQPTPTTVPTAVFVPDDSTSGGNSSGSTTGANSAGPAGQGVPPTSTSTLITPEPGALANTGNGPLTGTLALSGFLLIFIGAVINAYEQRRLNVVDPAFRHLA